MYIARKNIFFYKVVANTMQYKYQEVLPTLGTDHLCGMVKPTGFGPLMHSKNYTIIILRDATMLSCFIPKAFFFYLTCTVSSRTASRVQRKSQPGCHPHSAAACLVVKPQERVLMVQCGLLCRESSGTGKTLTWSPNYPNENLLTWIILLCDTVTHGPLIKWKGSCMNTDITTQTMYTIIAW